MEIRVSTKFSLIHLVFVLKEYLVKTFILFVAYFKQKPLQFNLEAFFLVCCICLNLFDQSFMGIDILNSL